MKHAITLLIATIGCSQPAQHSAFDPEPVVERSAVPPTSSSAGLEEPEDSPSTAEMTDVAEASFDGVRHPVSSESPPAIDDAAELSAVTVRAGESLDRLSRWSDTSVEEIAALNAIEITQPLLPGQVLAMPISDRESFEASRNGALEARLERYLSANGGLAGIEGYTVRTGDTAWAIAKEIAGVPSWVLAAFNSDTSLDRLSVGATLYLPIMTHVADAEQPMDELSLDGVDVPVDPGIMD